MPLPTRLYQATIEFMPHDEPAIRNISDIETQSNLRACTNSNNAKQGGWEIA
jgi:hypothetical protein